ncbi:hypothetical protein [Sphingomonas sp.]|uniref:hypothetical protein n=1 Tax=Sphingomonas sp. TaxID=28214 RepID=UPI002BF73B49|nr:hypothetical protein [Sphingomonas sp.]HTG39548.1 hypothetical protein [Sphingomonas sp.]
MMRALLPLIPLLGMAGCATLADNAGYPSLLPRAIEKRGFETPEPAEPDPVAADPALDRDVARLTATLDAARTAFAAAADQAEQLASRTDDAAPGSEAWIAAQVALADLDTLRGGTAGALADIERLAIDRAATGNPPYPALEALLAAARAQNEAEIARIARIEGMMRAA